MFGGAIDWGLIERHWQDLIQVVLSIRAGTITSEAILRRLGHESRKNRLYQVFRKLGRVNPYTLPASLHLRSTNAR